MVQTPPAVVPRDRPPRPARRPRRVPVTCSKRVAIAEIAQTRDDAELGGVPLGPPLRTQPAARVAREGNRRAVRQLAPRSVQITAHHARRAARGLQPAPQRLEGLDLHPPVRGIGNMNTVNLQRPRGRQCKHAERALGSGNCKWLWHLLKPDPRPDHHNRSPTASSAGKPAVDRGSRNVREPHQLKRAIPQRPRPPGDFLQRNDVRLSRC